MVTVALLAAALLSNTPSSAQTPEVVDGRRILELLNARGFLVKESEVQEFLLGSFKTEHGDYVWSDLAVGCSAKIGLAVPTDNSHGEIYNRALVTCRWRTREEARKNLLGWFAAVGHPRRRLPPEGGYSAQEIYYREDLQTAEGTGFFEAKLLKIKGVWMTVMIINPPGTVYVS